MEQPGIILIFCSKDDFTRTLGMTSVRVRSCVELQQHYTAILGAGRMELELEAWG